ncbi:uncharacterized protein MONBRDRAFT_10380 [Monosiga brevicollis MX1]|uniref:Aminotransferase class V domain-containing protein n=1 Tax=Monosiga brevicollis TaxID=81824 RepID=A9V617_MONBE|nr:uncharacterized protein MONBRDRAFT_10380 [Monosiga brevicollis MX1]EDQ86996.1 predicted protein [Monosiga brevicollis MX1]|eukprot:XP_001748235.1 hypothetical protein [Monosiga brevicollis MX1]
MFRKTKKMERNKYDDQILKAVLESDAKALRTLVEKKRFSSLIAADNDGRVPIYEACRLGFTECAEIILEAESEAHIPDEEGRNPLHMASLNGHVECVKLLCSKSNIAVDTPDLRGQTAAMHAAIAGHTDVLTFLLMRGADPEVTDHDGNTCLLLAIRANQRETAICLLNHSINVNAQNRQQKSALMFACELGLHELVTMLLQRGSQVDLRDTGGRSAYSYAKLNNHARCLELLPEDADQGSADSSRPASTTDLQSSTKYPPPSRATNPQLNALREQVEELTEKLKQEQEAHASVIAEKDHLQAELSAYFPAAGAGSAADGGSSAATPSCFAMCANSTDNDLLGSIDEDGTDAEQSTQALKAQLGAMAKAKNEADAEVERLQQRVRELESSQKSGGFSAPFGDDDGGGSIPLVVFNQIKESQERRIRELEAQVQGKGDAVPTNGTIKAGDVQLTALVELYRSALVQAVQLAEYIKANQSQVVFTENASAAINAVLRSLAHSVNDTFLVLSCAYAMVSNTLTWLASQKRASVLVVEVEFPLASEDDVVTLVEQALIKHRASHPNATVRLALFSHIVSIPPLRFPIAKLAAASKAHGVQQVMVDGAHALGQIELDMGKLAASGVDYYAGNGHKWLYSPKGTAFLWVREGLEADVTPTVVSSEWAAHDYARDFLYTGTRDYTAFTSIKAAFDFRSAIGGDVAIRTYMRQVAQEAGHYLSKLWGTRLAGPLNLTDAMVAVELPEAIWPLASTLMTDIAQDYNIQIVAFQMPTSLPKTSDRPWWMRLSAQVYVELDDMKRVGEIILNLAQQRKAIDP